MAAASRSFGSALDDSFMNCDAGVAPLRMLLVNDGNSKLDFTGFQAAGYSLYSLCTAKDALKRSYLGRPDLILLDLCFPDIDGKQFLLSLREWTNAPIVVMSVRHEESEKIACLDNGADDYVTKPFMMGELLARLRAALRRGFGIPRNEVFLAGELTLDFSRRAVFIGNEPVKLTATEYDLLKVLASHAGTVRTHYQLIHELWGTPLCQDAVHLLRVTISNLRRKLRDSRVLRLIVTEPGVGYRLQSN